MARLPAVGLLVALAGCGRIGYERAPSVGGQDAAIPSQDAAISSQDAAISSQDGAGGTALDPRPDAAGDVRPEAVASVDVAPEATAARDVAPEAMPSVDVVPPRDTADSAVAPPRDAGSDAPAARTVVATGQTATPRRGGSAPGTVDVCPDGRVLVGYEGTQSTNPSSPLVRSMVGICATVTFPPPGAPATAWALTRLPARGDPSGAPWARMCPARHVLIGFDGNAGNWWIGQLVLRCAAITLAPSGQSVLLGSAIELDDVGGQGSTDFPETDCPAGQVAKGAETSGATLLEAFGLICGTPALR